MHALVFIVILYLVEPHSFSAVHENEEQYSEPFGCSNTSFGSTGSVQYLAFPEQYTSSTACDWEIDVTRGFVVDLEFEVFRLPVHEKTRCDSYLVISYNRSQDEIFRRLICPTDSVNNISTGSQTVRVHFKSGAYPSHASKTNNTLGFKISYTAVAVKKPSDNHAVLIVLLVFATLISACLIFWCLQSRLKPSNIATDRVIIQPTEASARDDIQSLFELQRHVLQAPQAEKKYLSRTSSVNSKVLSEKCFENRPIPRAVKSDCQEKLKVSIGSTPHLVLDEPRRKWNSEKIRRIRNLRTKLVARFSSHSNSDVSVFYDATDRRSYSLIDCLGDDSPEEPTASDRGDGISRADPKPIPSFVIELID